MAIGPRLSQNRAAIATVSLGSWKYHNLPDRLRQAADAGFQSIDLMENDWAQYLRSHLGAVDEDKIWEPTAEKLAIAKKLGDLVKDLNMSIVCAQPVRQIEGFTDPKQRMANLASVVNRFPFLRAFDTDMLFLVSNIGAENSTIELKTVANDLRELGDMAAAFARQDGGPMIKIGYEGLSWALRNTWSSTWEVVRAANRPNVGLIVDSFNWLAVEFADPYNNEGHGRIYPTLEESLDVLCSSIASMVASVPAEKIFLLQIADAELIDTATLNLTRYQNPDAPQLLPWSRNFRLFPMEEERGAYMPVELITAAILAAGYEGPLSMEVFSRSLERPDADVPKTHAQRAFRSFEMIMKAAELVPKFWGTIAPACAEKWGAKLLAQTRTKFADRPLTNGHGETRANRVAH
ncbi:3-dehydroshikimate dehydratase [Histoplasma capsulatum var. duboisii H88]|uniref:3-dehydroshikimate dehydratase n=1 Tax=Ajellomyces capsulatus (strain H88) TaxID=544711 RepID=F0UC30_AJEC8|nr:3-dehydroshikimate dehydratase [Histoplasma capsulatum var. duboisii H88]QSS50135.1 3-dehydroshikimate dehydratase [Histoplasma capsulatum var. duboisii H88]